ncbi:hypothetical protein GW17_00029249, partial [Ensete ventricosum]
KAGLYRACYDSCTEEGEQPTDSSSSASASAFTLLFVGAVGGRPYEKEASTH